MPVKLGILVLTFSFAAVVAGIAYLTVPRTYAKALSGAATGASYQVNQPIEIISSPRVVLESGTITLMPSASGWRGPGDALLALIGGGAELRIEDGVLTVGHSRPAELPNLGGAPRSLAPLAQALTQSNFRSIEMLRCAVIVKSGGDRHERLEQLEANVQKRLGAFNAAGHFRYRDQDVSFEAEAGAGSATLQPIEFKLDSALFDMTVDGSFSREAVPALSASVSTISIPNIRSLARWFGAPWPSGSGLQDFRAAGQLEWRGRTIALNEANLSMDGNVANGTLTLSFDGVRPSLDGTIASERLDISRYFDQGQSVDPGIFALASEGEAPSFAVPIVRHLDADLRVSADNLAVPGATFGRTAATVSTRGGKLMADVAELAFGSGSIANGQLHLDMSAPQPQYGIRAKLTGADAAALTTALFQRPVLHGAADTLIDVTAVGASADAIISTLSGRIEASLPAGGRLGFDAAAVSSAARAGSPVIWRASSQRQTAVDTFSAQFALADGIARGQTLALAAGAQQIAADGSLNIAARTVDMRVSLSDSGEAQREPLSATWLKIIGAWSAPDVRLVTPPTRAERVTAEKRRPG